MSKISILGSGSWGTALAVNFGSNGHNVLLWSKFEDEIRDIEKNGENKQYLPGIKIPESVGFTADISLCADADVVIMASPSKFIRGVAKEFSTHVKDGQKIVCVSKGFDENGHKRLSEVIKEEIPNASVCAMSGPSHAEEVSRFLPTTNVIACEDIEVAKEVANMLISSNFRLYTTDDVTGVELGGALKNIIALCAGISDGYGFGDNTKAALMTRGMAEIIRLGVAMGAKTETFTGLSGFGDLIVTCTSMHSRNRRAGILIGKGKSAKEAQEEVKMVVEGIYATNSAYILSKKYNVEMPIVKEAYMLLSGDTTVDKCVENLMGRPMKNEREKYIKI